METLSLAFFCILALPPEMKFTFTAGSLKRQLSLGGRQIPVAGADPVSTAYDSDMQLTGMASRKVSLTCECQWWAPQGVNLGGNRGGNIRKVGDNY